MIRGRTTTGGRRAHWFAALVTLAVLVCVALFTRAGLPPQPATLFSIPELTLDSADRILILAPHPDDETIGCGGVIQKAVGMGVPVRVVFLTNGDSNELSFMLYQKRPEVLPSQAKAMGLVREDEAIAAGRSLGLRPEQLSFLGYPDFGTLTIWTAHWGDRPALRSILTRVTAVPYPNAYRPGAAYKGEEVLADLEAILRDFRPTKIFVSHPADHNPDHLALYSFTRVALWDLGMSPELYPYLVHYPSWPEPRGQAPDWPLTPPVTLLSQTRWQISSLSRDEVNRKSTALHAHRTQYAAAPHYLPSFVRTNELFGNFLEPTLHTGDTETLLSREAGTTDAPATEELNETQRAVFVGLEGRSVRREQDDLVISVVLSRPLAQGVAWSGYLFGYRPDKPFAQMPKIRITLEELRQAAFDQDRELSDARLNVTRNSRQITLRIPLALLDNPDRLFVYSRTYLMELPLDSAAWRLLWLPRN